jgi:hypothetical protein
MANEVKFSSGMQRNQNPPSTARVMIDVDGASEPQCSELKDLKKAIVGSLPVASDKTLGAVVIGDNLSITEEGVLSAQKGGIEESPADGKSYVRKDGEWIPVDIIEESPADGKFYVRQNGEWVILPVPPSEITLSPVALTFDAAGN